MFIDNRYSVRCKACKTRWIEKQSYFADCGADHRCAKIDEARSHIGEVYRGFKQTSYNVSCMYFQIQQVSWEPRADGTTSQCGSKCMSAKGPSCDCKCRGENHGAH
jgi:hypothetical protein